MDDRKQRGQYRKLKALLQHIDQFVPFSKTDQKCEVWRVPSSPFIESSRTSGKVKTAFCRKWLETTEKFLSQKPEELGFCKVVALLSVPNFWASQIIIFYDKDYYESFWHRTEPPQLWVTAQEKRSFCKERNISTVLPEVCFHEKVSDEDATFACDLWFYGELPPI